MEKLVLMVTIMDAFLTFGSLCMMLYALKTFLQKPRTNLETRVTTLEVELKDVKDSLQKGNDKFRTIRVAGEVMLHALIALIDFEIQYCLTEHKELSDDLEKARDDLNKFLRGGGTYNV